MLHIKLPETLIFLLGLTVTVGLLLALSASVSWLQKKLGRSSWGRRMKTWGVPLAMETIYDLKPGQRYLVRQSFTDYYGNSFIAGETITFIKRDFLPYHGGHTIFFAEKTLYLQEEENAGILQDLARYFEPEKSI